MKKRHQAQGNLLRWNKENNFYRPHLRHQPYRSNNESRRTYPPFRGLLTTTATETGKTMRILRHGGGPREDDGAIERGKLLSMFHREDPEWKRWTKQVRLNHLEKGSNKKYSSIARTPMETCCTCVPSKATPEETELTHLCRTLWKFPYNWIEHIHHVGSSP